MDGGPRCGRPNALGFSRQCSRDSVAHAIGSGFAAASASRRLISASGSACRWMMLNCSSLNAIGFGDMAGPLRGLTRRLRLESLIVMVHP
jgi:hypothetical protein